MVLTSPVQRYVLAGAAVIVATGIMLAMRSSLDALNVGLIFLVIAFVLALVAGSGPASVAAIFGFCALDFFFVPPIHKFTVYRPSHVVGLFVYLGITIATGHLVARVRSRTELAVREQRRTTLLYELNAALIGNVKLDSILASIVERVVSVYGAQRCRILLASGDESLMVRSTFPITNSAGIDRDNLAIANWVMEHRKPAGKTASDRRLRLPHPPGEKPTRLRQRGPDVFYLPIATAERVIGVMEVSGRPAGGRFEEDDKQLLTTFADQAALALEQARLIEEATRAEVLAESDELKSALLAAVSHDLRTPLATIKASATSLLDRSVNWDEQARFDFLKAIDDETDRLTLMVANLLDLSRIEGGALKPDKDWYDAAELITDVANRLANMADRHTVATAIEPDLPLAYLDYIEIAQVLMNLGDNARKYSPAGATIQLSVRRVHDDLEFMVHDDGACIPERDRRKLFEKFYRGGSSKHVPGSGIGLAISQGMVKAHGGQIWISCDDGQGNSFRFTIPLPANELSPS
jgi:two-component system sensor histidine kinase KdpD